MSQDNEDKAKDLTALAGGAGMSRLTTLSGHCSCVVAGFGGEAPASDSIYSQPAATGGITGGYGMRNPYAIAFDPSMIPSTAGVVGLPPTCSLVH